MATPTKNWKEDLELLGVLLGATAFNLVTSVPRALGFARRTFVIDGRTVVRPDAFSDRPQKRAFEEVAMFLVQSGRDDLARFRDDEILRNFHGDRDRAPLEVWHEVLAWFAAQGHLTAGWALLFRYSPGTHVIVPSWDRDGNKGEWWNRSAWVDGVRPPFCPWLLTDAERDALVGASYAAMERASVTDPAHLPRRLLDVSCFVRAYGRT